MDAKGIIVDIDVTAVTDTPGATLTISEVLENGQTILLLTAAKVTAISKGRHIICTGAGAASGDVKTVVGWPITPGRSLRFSMAHDDTDSITYTVLYGFI